MMNYKIIDGKVYKVEEVSTDDLKIEVEQVIGVVNEQNEKKRQLLTQLSKTQEPIDSQIVSLENQLASINIALENLKNKKISIINSYNPLLLDCDDKIQKAKNTLSDKQEIIKSLLPEQSKKLGF